VKVLGVGVTNQRETTVVWCKQTGRPLCNAIVWMDTRTSALCKRLCRQHGGAGAFARITGLPINTYFSVYKYLWMVEHVSAVAEAVEEGRAAFGTIDSWLIYSLTGGGAHVTDVSNASRTGLMDLQACAWHEPTCAALGVPLHVLPTIKSNAEMFGHVQAGPLQGVPICGCLGDQQAATLGQRCRMGEAKNTYGTGCFLILNTGPTLVHSSHGLLSTVAFKLGPVAQTQYALEGSVAIAGAGVTWLRDNLGIIASAKEVEALAGSSADAAGVVFVPAFGGLLAPHWRDDARGTICGLTQYSTRSHIARALLEAICFQTREVLDAMQADARSCRLHLSLATLRVDGGASSNNLLMQMQADILGQPVVRPADVETTALGAALAAGVALGLWSGDSLLSAHHAREGATEFNPRCSEAERASMYLRWKAAVERSLGWVNTPEEKEGVSLPPGGGLPVQLAAVDAGRSQLRGVAIGAAAGLCAALIAVRLRHRVD
jgi:glycerol kinase